jgi:hypothetical protein
MFAFALTSNTCSEATNMLYLSSGVRQFASLVSQNDGSSVRLEYQAFYFICFVKTFCGNIYNKTA